jgi:hypothetical protein
MRHFSTRLLVSLVTFTAGVTLVWALHRLETVFVDRWFVVNNGDVSPVRLVDEDGEANEIYRLVVGREVSADNDRTVLVLRSKTTNWQPDGVKIKELLPEIEPQTFDSYLEKNKVPHELKVSNLGPRVVLGDLEFSDDIEKFWSTYYKRYPHAAGILSLSDVGFNNNHDQAIVYEVNVCGDLCGVGKYVLLCKSNGKWEVLREGVLWIS